MSEQKISIKKIFSRFTFYLIIGIFLTFIIYNLIEYGFNIKKYIFNFGDLIHNYTYLLFSVIGSYVIDVLSKKFKKSTK